MPIFDPVRVRGRSAEENLSLEFCQSAQNDDALTMASEAAGELGASDASPKV